MRANSPSIDFIDRTWAPLRSILSGAVIVSTTWLWDSLKPNCFSKSNLPDACFVNSISGNCAQNYPLASGYKRYWDKEPVCHAWEFTAPPPGNIIHTFG